MVYSLWFMAYGSWFIVECCLCMVHGSWFMVYGLWFGAVFSSSRCTSTARQWLQHRSSLRRRFSLMSLRKTWVNPRQDWKRLGQDRKRWGQDWTRLGDLEEAGRGSEEDGTLGLGFKVEALGLRVESLWFRD